MFKYAGSAFITKFVQLIKGKLSKVATSGSYNDLGNKPHEIVYAKCTTASAIQQKNVVLDDTTYKLKDGDILHIWFTNNNSFNATATNPVTFKIGSDVYQPYRLVNEADSGTVPTGTVSWIYGQANIPSKFKVDVTHKKLIFCGRYWDDNSTYTQASLGQGYGTCTTAAATAAKVVTLGSYALVVNGIVSVKFTYAVPANATMNINSKGAKEIWYRGAKITAGIINAGDIATFIYDNTRYQLIAIDTPHLKLGETSSTAYAGDKGKTLADKVAALPTSYAPVDAEKNVQSDWNVTDADSDAYIKNKPTIPSADGFMTKENPTGSGSFSMNRKSSTTIGYRSHAEGSDGTASAPYAHAEGGGTTASGNSSHAEGSGGTASALCSHSEGGATIASGDCSHSEGKETVASATGAHAEGYIAYAYSDYSHAEGHGTVVPSGVNAQHVQGRYNIESRQYAHIVGNGTDGHRSNAHTLDWNGNAWFAGNVTVGTNSDRLAKVSEIPNENLLINPDFRINQRGQASYLKNDRYTVDRWKMFNSNTLTMSVTPIDSGIFLHADTGTGQGYIMDLSQSFERMLEVGVYTISAKINGTVRVAIGEITDTKSIYDGFFIVNRNMTILRCDDTDKTIEWVKLERGNTATPFVHPDPATELLKCQRYFYAVIADTDIIPPIAIAPSSSRYAIAGFRFPTPMRTDPRIAITRMTDWSGANDYTDKVTAIHSNASGIWSVDTSVNLMANMQYSLRFTADAEI